MTNSPVDPPNNAPSSDEDSTPRVSLEELRSSGAIKPIVTEVVKEEIKNARSRYSTQVLYGGLGFFGTSFFLLLSLVVWLLSRGSVFSATILETMPDDGVVTKDWLILYLNAYSVPIFLIFSTLICIVVGYILLNQAGALVRTVIPKEDQEFLKRLNLQDEKGVEQYIRLTSLTGVTGFFTKIGITGLPLATIVLTLTFGALALFFDQGNNSSKFFDFANLTLGAFLGSYVQKKASDAVVKN